MEYPVLFRTGEAGSRVPVQEIWKQSLARFRQGSESAAGWVRSCHGYLRSSLGNLPLLSSIEVAVGKGNPDRDESHYFLVPDPAGKEGFTLVERRKLPEGVGTVNSLPKLRVFHVHDPSALEVLESQLVGRISASARTEAGLEADIAARLESLGEEIDKQSHFVTGGLVLVGGVVAVANPLMGVAIAAKALLPELGGKLAKFGFGAAADSVRRFGSWRKSESAKRSAAAEVRRMKPELVTDPALRFADRVVAAAGRVDPFFAELAETPEWWKDREMRFSLGVVAEVWSGGTWGRWADSVRERVASFEGAEP